MSRTGEIREALEAAVAEIAPHSKALSAGTKYPEGTQSFALRVLVGDPEDEDALRRLDEMLDDDGERSIKRALEANVSLGGPINSLFVARHSGHRLFQTPAGPVLGAEWVIDLT